MRCTTYRARGCDLYDMACLNLSISATETQDLDSFAGVHIAEAPLLSMQLRVCAIPGGNNNGMSADA